MADQKTNWEIFCDSRSVLRDDFNRKITSGEIVFEEVPCLCGGEKFVPVAKRDVYGVLQTTVICVSCGLIQSMPRMTEKSYEWFYGSDYYRKLSDPFFKEKDVSIITNNDKSGIRHQFIKQNLEYPKCRKILEIGCAGGWNLYPFFKDGKNVTGYDYGKGWVEEGKKLGMDLRVGSFNDIPGGELYDLIILSHIFEHLLNPLEVLEKLSDHLSPGGCFYIEVPNIDYFGLTRLQNAHTYYFTDRTLIYFLDKINLSPLCFQTNIISYYMGGLFGKKKADNGSPPLSLASEYHFMAKKIFRHKVKNVIIKILQRLNLYSFAKKTNEFKEKIMCYFRH